MGPQKISSVVHIACDMRVELGEVGGDKTSKMCLRNLRAYD